MMQIGAIKKWRSIADDQKLVKQFLKYLMILILIWCRGMLNFGKGHKGKSTIKSIID